MFSSRRRARVQTYTTIGLAAASAAVAAATVYLLDPKSGKNRREMLRDRMARASRQSYNFAAKMGRRSKRHLRAVSDSVPF
jgi:hypothetical protein